MLHRGLVRAAVAASAAMIVGAIAAASPAAAQETTPAAAAPTGTATLNIPDDGVLAKDFATKGCVGIPGGAKTGTDGWLFNQPAKGTKTVIYTLGFLKHNGDKAEILVFLIAKDGLKAFSVDPTKTNDSGDDKAKALAQRAEQGATDGSPDGKGKGGTEGNGGTPAQPGLPDGVTEIPVPAGVAGALFTDLTGAWLQTPAGWLLGGGELVFDKRGTDGAETFDLLRTCLPAAAPTASPSPTTGGVGGGTGTSTGGGSLPVTGTNVGILAGAGVLLIAVGALLVVARRRRNAVKFTA
jgi:LPXTG-motif cell wall-anchored protein